MSISKAFYRYFQYRKYTKESYSIYKPIMSDVKAKKTYTITPAHLKLPGGPVPQYTFPRDRNGKTGQKVWVIKTEKDRKTQDDYGTWYIKQVRGKPLMEDRAVVSHHLVCDKKSGKFYLRRELRASPKDIELVGLGSGKGKFKDRLTAALRQLEDDGVASAITCIDVPPQIAKVDSLMLEDIDADDSSK